MAEKSKNPAVLSSEETLKRAGFYTRILREFVKNRYAVIGLLCIVVIVLLSVFASNIASYDPLERNAIDRLVGPSRTHLMGTDSLGRDVFTRVLYGGQISLLVGFLSIVLSVIISVPLGLIAGYFGGIFSHASEASPLRS